MIAMFAGTEIPYFRNTLLIYIKIKLQWIIFPGGGGGCKSRQMDEAWIDCWPIAFKCIINYLPAKNGVADKQKKSRVHTINCFECRVDVSRDIHN